MTRQPHARPDPRYFPPEEPESRLSLAIGLVAVVGAVLFVVYLLPVVVA
mgnify:CR=1 FL=1